VKLIENSRDRTEICRDLGYYASDIMQSNCIIWVEGPSDRIYLTHWIEKQEPQFTEGIHYSIMFYGGRLLSHLTGKPTDEIESELAGFISLREMNRSAVILIDSDKDKPRRRLNKTKQRMREEFDEGPGFGWITKGREIENYLDYEILVESIRKVHPRATSIPKDDPYTNLLKIKKTPSSDVSTADKVRIAREYVKLSDEVPDVPGLHQHLPTQLRKLCNFIRDTNEHNPEETSANASS